MSETPEPTIDFGYPTEAQGKIPSFSSIEEEAEFWDTHDSTDFLDSLVPVEVTIGPNFPRSVTLQLSPDEGDALDPQAKREGIEPSTLAKRWVVEHLRDVDAKAS